MGLYGEVAEGTTSLAGHYTVDKYFINMNPRVAFTAFKEIAFHFVSVRVCDRGHWAYFI